MIVKKTLSRVFINWPRSTTLTVMRAMKRCSSKLMAHMRLWAMLIPGSFMTKNAFIAVQTEVVLEKTKLGRIPQMIKASIRRARSTHRLSITIFEAKDIHINTNLATATKLDSVIGLNNKLESSKVDSSIRTNKIKTNSANRATNSRRIAIKTSRTRNLLYLQEL